MEKESRAFKVLLSFVMDYSQVKEQGCDCYQGYLVSPPVPADQFEQLLRAQMEDTEK